MSTFTAYNIWNDKYNKSSSKLHKCLKRLLWSHTMLKYWIPKRNTPQNYITCLVFLTETQTIEMWFLILFSTWNTGWAFITGWRNLEVWWSCWCGRSTSHSVWWMYGYNDHLSLHSLPFFSYLIFDAGVL